MLAAGSIVVTASIAIVSARFPRANRFGYRTSRILLITRQILKKYPREGYRSRVAIR